MRAIWFYHGFRYAQLTDTVHMLTACSVDWHRSHAYCVLNWLTQVTCSMRAQLTATGHMLICVLSWLTQVKCSLRAQLTDTGQMLNACSVDWHWSQAIVISFVAIILKVRFNSINFFVFNVLLHCDRNKLKIIIYFPNMNFWGLVMNTCFRQLGWTSKEKSVNWFGVLISTKYAYVHICNVMEGDVSILSFIK